MLTGLTLTESDRRARQVAPDAHLCLIEIRSQIRFAAGGEVAGLWDLRLVSPVCGEEGLLNKRYLWTKGGMEESLLKEWSSSFNCWYARGTSCQEKKNPRKKQSEEMQNNPHLLLPADWLIGTWRISELSKPLKAPTVRHLQVYSDLTAAIPQVFSKSSSIWHILLNQIKKCLNILTIFLWFSMIHS